MYNVQSTTYKVHWTRIGILTVEKVLTENHAHSYFVFGVRSTPILPSISIGKPHREKKSGRKVRTVDIMAVLAGGGGSGAQFIMYGP
jgi:hypothetical protein